MYAPFLLPIFKNGPNTHQSPRVCAVSQKCLYLRANYFEGNRADWIGSAIIEFGLLSLEFQRG